MSTNPDQEASQLRRLQDWWLALPLSYRVNALLYFLGGCALLFLVTTLFTGDDEPRQIQVGAGATVPASTTTSRASLTTTVPPTAPTTVTTTATPSSTTGGGSVTTAPSGARGGGDTTTTPPTQATTTAPTTAPTTTTTAAPPPCRNSFEPRCGDFTWDPSPGANEPLTINAVPRPANPRPGDIVTFDITVADPDHLLNDNCAEVSFGDGATLNAACIPQPTCPAVYGPWTPPSRQPGNFTKSYTHIYQGAGQFVVRFTFRSWSTDRCPGLDPYASERTAQLVLTVASGT